MYNNHGNQNIKGKFEGLDIKSNAKHIIRAVIQAKPDQLNPRTVDGRKEKTKFKYVIKVVPKSPKKNNLNCKFGT
jgi:hypothetical protein